MKPFRFSLQSIRTLREQKERTAQQCYSEALRMCEEAAAQVKSASDELSECWSAFRGMMAAGTSGLDLLRTRAWCNVLELRLKERTTALEKARLVVDAAWQTMMRATRDREALDRYYDKSRAAHNRKEQSEEQKRLDELALRRNPLRAAARFSRSTMLEHA